jgi:chromosome segregation ATPase
LNDEIASSKELLQSCRISCQHKRQEAENLNNEISRLESVVTRFKSNNEEYLKIQKMVEEVSKFLADGKVLLQFALASIIEAIRRNPDKYNSLLVCNISSSSTSTPAQDSLVSPIEDYKDLILDEAKRLYDKLLNHFTNSIIDNAAGASSSSFDPILSSTFPNLSNQSYTYRIEESEGFHNSKGDIAD